MAAINPEFFNGTTQLKTIRFYWNKNRLAKEHTENKFSQLNCHQQRRQPWSGTWTSCRSSPRCSWQGTPSPPWSSGSGHRFCCEALLWPLIQRRPTKNCPKGFNQGSWDARSPSPTPPWGSSGANPVSSWYCGQGRLLAGRWNVDFQISGPSFDSFFSTVVLEMFISCVWDLINLLVPPEMSSFRSAARTCPLWLLILLS